jgi:hypothetical protein
MVALMQSGFVWESECERISAILASIQPEELLEQNLEIKTIRPRIFQKGLSSQHCRK